MIIATTFYDKNSNLLAVPPTVANIEKQPTLTTRGFSRVPNLDAYHEPTCTLTVEPGFYHRYYGSFSAQKHYDQCKTFILDTLSTLPTCTVLELNERSSDLTLDIIYVVEKPHRTPYRKRSRADVVIDYESISPMYHYDTAAMSRGKTPCDFAETAEPDLMLGTGDKSHCNAMTTPNDLASIHHLIWSYLAKEYQATVPQATKALAQGDVNIPLVVKMVENNRRQMIGERTQKTQHYCLEIPHSS